MQYWNNGFGIGFTTVSPDSGPVQLTRDSIRRSDQHWCLLENRNGCTAHHKEQSRTLPWELSLTVGKTVGCSVSEDGEFHLCYNGMDVDDVVWRGLPTDQPLWGFAYLQGAWKVEANYEVATPNGEAVGGLTWSCVAIPFLPSILYCDVIGRAEGSGE